MPILRTRNRTIAVRLSDHEYAELMRLAASRGAHSTSDVARQALAEFLRREGVATAAEPVQERIAQLESEMKKLSRVLATLASVAKDQS